MVTDRHRNIYEGAAGQTPARPAGRHDDRQRVRHLLDDQGDHGHRRSAALSRRASSISTRRPKTYAPDIGKLQVHRGLRRQRAEPRAAGAEARHHHPHADGAYAPAWRYDLHQSTPTTAWRRRRGSRASSRRPKASLMTPLLFDPGERWEYGTNMDWCGQIVEAITGERLGEVFKTRIFEPLGIHGHRPSSLTDAMRRKLAGIHAARCRRLVDADGFRAAGRSGNPHGRPRALRHDRRLHALHPDVAE